MKKIITTFIFGLMVAASLPALATTAQAQRNCNTNNRSNYNNGNYNNARYNNNGDRNRNYAYKRPNVYRRHRKAFNIGIGTGIGMLVGGMLGGKKGLAIGGLAGAGGGAIFTHKQKPKNYVRYYRN
ncbi:MAG: hypothetical protein WBD16_07515 [Pyrinomonadaceae bacterium]